MLWDIVIHPFVKIFENHPDAYFSSGSMAKFTAFKSHTKNRVFSAFMEDLVVSGKLDRYKVFGKNRYFYKKGTGLVLEAPEGFQFQGAQGPDGKILWSLFIDTFHIIYETNPEIALSSGILGKRFRHCTRVVGKEGHKNWGYKAMLEELLHMGTCVRFGENIHYYVSGTGNKIFL